MSAAVPSLNRSRSDGMEDWPRRAPALENKAFSGSYYFLPAPSAAPLAVRVFLHGSHAWFDAQGVARLMRAWVENLSGAAFKGGGHLSASEITFASESDKAAYLEAWDNGKFYDPFGSILSD